MLRKGLAAFLVIVFFLLFPFGLIALATQTMLLNPGFYKDLLVKNDVYSQSYLLMLANSSNSKEFSRAIPLSNSEMEQVLRQAVPQEFVQRQTELAIDEFFAWLGSSDPTPRINISLKEVKSRLPDAVAMAIENKVAKLPPCPNGLPPRVNGFPECVPLGVSSETLKNLVHPEALAAGQAMARTLPDSTDLFETIGKSGSDGRNVEARLNSLKRSVGMIQMASLIVEVLLVVLLLFIGVIMSGPTKRALKWMGVTLLVSGLVALGGFLFVQFVGSVFFEHSIEAVVRGPSEAWTIVIVGLVRTGVEDFLTRLSVESGITVAVGLILLGSRRFLK